MIMENGKSKSADGLACVRPRRADGAGDTEVRLLENCFSYWGDGWSLWSVQAFN
jgi:hypothetical protein